MKAGTVMSGVALSDVGVVRSNEKRLIAELAESAARKKAVDPLSRMRGATRLDTAEFVGAESVTS